MAYPLTDGGLNGDYGQPGRFRRAVRGLSPEERRRRIDEAFRKGDFGTARVLLEAEERERKAALMTAHGHCTGRYPPPGMFDR